MAVTVFAPAYQCLWTLLKSKGVNPRPVFREAGIDPKLIRDVNARLPYAAAARLWARTAELTGDPHLGLTVAENWHPSWFNALGYAWLTSSTLRTALDRLQHYIRVTTDRTHVILEESRQGLAVRFEYVDVANPIDRTGESAVGIGVAMCRAAYGKELNPKRVTFRHAAPENPGPYYAFFRGPLKFNAPADSFTLTRQVVDQPLPGDNPLLAQLNDQYMIRYLARLNRDRITDRVKAEIIDRLPSGGVSDETVAAALDTSVRSLQRTLQEEGTTFKTLLEETRQDLAEKYIRDKRTSITEIGFLLGFSEPSAFSRAFRRWTGRSPSDYRTAA